MKFLNRIYLLCAFTIVGLAFTPAAHADENPDGCSVSQPKFDFSEATSETLKSPVRIGDQIEVGAMLVPPTNSKSSCGITDLRILVHLPSRDGTAGEGVELVSGVDIPAGTTNLVLGESLPYTVDFDDNVFQAFISLSWTAVVRDGSSDSTLQGEAPSQSLQVTRPSAVLTISPSLVSGEPPLSVTYKYSLLNNSPSVPEGLRNPGLGFDPIAGPASVLSDENCDPIVFSGAVAPAPNDLPLPSLPVLFPGWSWSFTCSRTFTLPGTYLSRPVLSATSDADGRPWPAVSADSTVTVFGSDLIVAKSHEGDLLAGRTGEYKLRVTNRGNRSTVGAVSLTDQLPAGLEATALSGDGWTCETSGLTCRRSDRLDSGLSYPEVTLKVKVAANPPSHVVNTASVSGGGEPNSATTNNTATDPTRIRTPAVPAGPKGSSFRITSVNSRPNGSVRISVSVTNAGRLTADDAGKPNLIKRAIRRTRLAGTYSLVLKPTPAFRRALKRSKKARKVRIRVNFKAKRTPARSTARRVTFRFNRG